MYFRNSKVVVAYLNAVLVILGIVLGFFGLVVMLFPYMNLRNSKRIKINFYTMFKLIFLSILSTPKQL